MSARMVLAVVGHVDHGKSTILGRLLADTGVLPEGKLEQIKHYCERNSRPFEYAFLLDALHDERSQGITIDSARVFFQSSQRRYLVMDCPGHMEFLKNMVTGSAQADAALFVVDAQEGLKENSLRHAHMLSLLGVRDVIVLINKMDLVGFAQARFEELRREISEFMTRVGLSPLHYLPVSGRDGDGLAHRPVSEGHGLDPASGRLAWHGGPTLLEALDALQVKPLPVDGAFRMPVQDVYKFTEHGDDRRIVAGQIESGRLTTGDSLVFYPSEKTAKVARIESFGTRAPTELSAGASIGFTLDQPLYLRRGELAVRACEKPPVCASDIRVNLFWLGRKPLQLDRDYLLKLGAAKVNARLTAIERILDASTLETKERADGVGRYEVAQVTMSLDRPLAFDLESGALNRFVLVDEYEIRGGGIIREALGAKVNPEISKPAALRAAFESSGNSVADAFYGIGCEY